MPTPTAAITERKYQKAYLRYLHIAPRKVRLIARTLTGLTAAEAEAQLLLRSQRAAQPLLKLLRSGVAGAKQNPNLRARGDDLVVREMRVDQGPMLKRSLPRAQGRATPIHKIMSHVTLLLQKVDTAQPPRFAIVPPVKKEKKKKAKAQTPKTPAAPREKKEEAKVGEKSGFFKRIFRRKTV